MNASASRVAPPALASRLRFNASSVFTRSFGTTWKGLAAKTRIKMKVLYFFRKRIVFLYLNDFVLLKKMFCNKKLWRGFRVYGLKIRVLVFTDGILCLTFFTKKVCLPKKTIAKLCLFFNGHRKMKAASLAKKKSFAVKYDERVKRREQLVFQLRDVPLPPGMRKKHVENMLRLHLPHNFLKEQEAKKELQQQDFHKEGLEMMRQWVPGEDMHVVERRKKIHKHVHHALKRKQWVQFDQLVQQLARDQIPFDEVTFNMISLGYLVSPSHGDDMALAMLQEMRACRFVHPSFFRLVEGIVLSHFEIKAVCGQGFSKKFLRKAIKTGWEVGLHFKRKRLANVRRYIRDHLSRGEQPDLNPDILAMLTTLDHKETQQILAKRHVVDLLYTSQQTKYTKFNMFCAGIFKIL